MQKCFCCLNWDSSRDVQDTFLYSWYEYIPRTNNMTIFRLSFFFHELSDQYKGTFCYLVLDNYDTFLHIASLPLRNFPCIQPAKGERPRL